MNTASKETMGFQTEVRQLLDLGGQDRSLNNVLFAAADAVAGFGKEAALAGT